MEHFYFQQCMLVLVINHLSCCRRSSLVLTAGDASVRGRLDGGGEGGIPDPLPLGQVWRQPRRPGYLQRTCGPEQQVWRLLLQAQRYYISTICTFRKRQVCCSYHCRFQILNSLCCFNLLFSLLQHHRDPCGFSLTLSLKQAVYIGFIIQGCN